VAACFFCAAVSRRAPDPAKKTPVGAEVSQNCIYSGDVSFTDNGRSYLIFSMHTKPSTVSPISSHCHVLHFQSTLLTLAAPGQKSHDNVLATDCCSEHKITHLNCQFTLTTEFSHISCCLAVYYARYFAANCNTR
jgi:hypothetical protein